MYLLSSIRQGCTHAVLTMDLQPPLEDKGKRKQIHLPLNQEASNCSSVGSAPHRL